MHFRAQLHFSRYVLGDFNENTFLSNYSNELEKLLIMYKIFT